MKVIFFTAITLKMLELHTHVFVLLYVYFQKARNLCDRKNTCRKHNTT